MDDNEKQNMSEKYDDYTLDRVPQEGKKHWFSIAVMRFGQVSALAQFLLGATLGFGMDFWTAFWAITIGAVLLEIVSIFVGIAGMREGMSTTLLVRWTGFGKYGSLLLSFILAVSMVGWFGVQNEVFAEGLQQMLGGQVWAWSIVTGLLVTLVVVFGILSIGVVAYITVPLFLIVVLYSVGTVFGDYSFGELINLPPPGDPISIQAGATMVAGSFMAGAIITPDISRFNRSKADVIKQTILGITLGEYLIGLIGVVLAHVIQSSDIISIVMGTSGFLGTIVLISATIKINDFNLYSPSLAIVNIVDSLFKKRVNRTAVTIIIGALGTLLSVMGILSQFEGFLNVLGVALPPVGGIITVEYFIIKRYWKDLNVSREKGLLPETYELWNPVALISWVAAFLVGFFIEWGIPSLNSLFTSGLLYLIISMVINRDKKVIFGSVLTYKE
ncbi:MAG TPA: cytosine permease [Virgibacillus sp.]|nr:cytosine permease [Virgibacillus sp.]